MFRHGGKTYGEEDIGRPQSEWASLSEEEVARRRELHEAEGPSAEEKAKRLAARRKREKERKERTLAKSVLRRPSRKKTVLR